MSARSPDPTDVHVGRRIRHARIAADISQTALANQIGVTFQQIQKYEGGQNRITAGRLQAIATILGRPVSWFLDGGPSPASAADGTPLTDAIDQFVRDPYGMALVKAFLAVRRPEVQRAFVKALEAYVEAQPEQGPARE